MTIGEMKKRLENYDDNLPVALEDWQELCHSPSTDAAAQWEVRKNVIVNNGTVELTEVLILGSQTELIANLVAGSR